MIETNRLILRPFKDADRSAFAKINADPDVMRFFPSTLDHAASDKLVDTFQERWAQDGFCFGAIETKSGEFVGMCGLNQPGFDAHFTPTVEIGWRLEATHWGQGFATEAATAWLTHGFCELGLPEIVAFTPHQNIPSRKVMDRLGMTRDLAGDFHLSSLGEDSPLNPLVLYRLTNPGL